MIRIACFICFALVCELLCVTGFSDTFYVGDDDGKLYAFDPSVDLDLRPMGALEGFSAMVGSLSYCTGNDLLYAISTMSNRVWALNPATGQSTSFTCNEVLYFAPNAAVSDDGKLLYAAATLAADKNVCGIAMDPSDGRIIRMFKGGVAGIGPNEGYAVDEAKVLAGSSDIVILNYHSSSLERFKYPYDSGEMIFERSGLDLRLGGIIDLPMKPIVVFRTSIHATELTVATVGDETEPAQAIPFSGVVELVRTAPRLGIWGLYNQEPNQVVLYNAEGDVVDKFRLDTYEPDRSEGDARPTLKAYRELKEDSGVRTVAPKSVWLSSDAKFTVLQIKGSHGYRGPGYIAVRNNLSGLWSDVVPVGRGAPLVGAHWTADAK